MLSRRAALLLAVLPIAAHASPFAYVTNTGEDDDDVTVIDLATDTVHTTLPQGDTFAHAVAVTPDGTGVFVTTQKGSFERYAVNEMLHTWVDWIDFTTNQRPRGMAVSSDGRHVYVALERVPAFAVVDNSSNPISHRVYPIVNGGGLFAEVDPDEEWLYIAHENGSVTIVDLTTLDPVTLTVSSTNRAGVVGEPGGTSMLGSWFVVSDVTGNRLKTLFSPTSNAAQSNAVAGSPRGVVTYMDGNARYLTALPGSDQLYSLTFGAIATGGLGPWDVAWSELGHVAVASNVGSDQVSVMRPTPVVISDPSLSAPTDVAIGPQLAPMPEPRTSTFAFDYKGCGETIIRTAKITNQGPGYLDLEKVKISGSAGYTLREDTCSGRRILPKKSCTIDYRLLVKADLGVKGMFNATATLQYSGGVITHTLAAKPLVKACQ